MHRYRRRHASIIESTEGLTKLCTNPQVAPFRDLAAPTGFSTKNLALGLGESFITCGPNRASLPLRDMNVLYVY